MQNRPITGNLAVKSGHTVAKEATFLHRDYLPSDLAKLIVDRLPTKIAGDLCPLNDGCAKSPACTDNEVLWLTIGAPEELEFLQGSKSRMDPSLIYPAEPK